MSLRLVDVGRRPVEPLADLLGPHRWAELVTAAERARKALGDRAFWVVNSTAAGGGVAEMLHAMLPLARNLGVDARWAVIGGDPGFFALTKRLCNGVYGEVGDGGELRDRERAGYERVCTANATELLDASRPGDVVLVTDPQPAGLVGPLRRAGRVVLWRCHIGHDTGNVATERAWRFLLPYVRDADGWVFSVAAHVPAGLAPDRTWVVNLSIDPFAVKNLSLSQPAVRSVLAAAGLVGEPGPAVTVDLPGRAPVTVRRRASVVRAGRPPAVDSPLVVQVSRWDRLKDMVGVLTGFVRYVDPALGARLLLVGPDVRGVADDPEAEKLFAECHAAWARMPAAERARVDLACLPMDDLDENALVVNAIQSHATVVVQKSWSEGFGLTATEAMWKERPVVASAVGGLREQLGDGAGLLVDDPADLAGFGTLVGSLIADPERARRLGAAARARVFDRYLIDRHLLCWARVLDRLGLD